MWSVNALDVVTVVIPYSSEMTRQTKNSMCCRYVVNLNNEDGNDEEDKWSTVAPMSKIRGSLASSRIGGTFYAIGGGIPSEQYSLVEGWASITPLPLVSFRGCHTFMSRSVERSHSMSRSCCETWCHATGMIPSQTGGESFRMDCRHPVLHWHPL